LAIWSPIEFFSQPTTTRALGDLVVVGEEPEG
jgi:hypothetical protein